MEDKEGLTADRLREVLDYDPLAGIFIRRERQGAGRNQLGEAGAVGPAGYRIIPIDGKSYTAHRLAWLYVTGAWPSRWVQHKNGIKSDNRIDNLMLRPEKRDGIGMRLDQKRLKEILEYDPQTGDFIWRVSSARGMKGSRAGVVDQHGYRVIKTDGKNYRANRRAWLYMKGVWPADQIDHADGNRANDVFVNLREANQSQNTANGKLRSTNTSGLKGVSWDKEKGKWVAGIKVNYKRKVLGRVDDKYEAHRAYLEAAEKIFGKFARKS